MLIEGKAEVFGRELPLKEPVYFHKGEKFAISTWHGAHIQFSGACDFYSSDANAMIPYVNVHSALNQMRQKALKTKTIGPTILITGQD